MLFFHRLVLILSLLLLVIFQAAIIPVFTGFFPDLLLIVVLGFCWLGKRDEALWAAFLGGILYDLLSVRPLGIRSLLLIAIVFVVSLVRRWVDNLPSRFLCIFLISLGWRLYPGFFFSTRLVYLALIDAVIFAVLFPALAALFNRIFVEEELQLEFRLK
jgi:rod shape-determining protein MreD